MFKRLAILVVLNSFVASIAFGKCPAIMTLMTPNKTDMKKLVGEYKENGWETKGKLIFKEYIGFFQVIILSCEAQIKNEKNAENAENAENENEENADEGSSL